MPLRDLMSAASIAAYLALASITAPAAHAASETVDFAAVRSLAAGLGLEDNGDKKTYVRADNQGSQNYSVWLSPSDEGASLLIYTFLEDIAADKMKSVPMQGMLEFNDTHPIYFSINDNNGAKRIFLQCRLAGPAVTPQVVRKTIDGLLGAADETKDLWKAANWKEASAAPEAVSFTTHHAMFVTQRTDTIGDYHPRPSNAFAPGEKLITYVEPVGFDYKPVGPDTYQFGVTIDLELRTKGGKIIGGQTNFMNQNLTSHEKPKEFFLDITLNLDAAPADEYVVAYTLHDNASNRTTRIEQPFTIQTGARAKP